MLQENQENEETKSPAQHCHLNIPITPPLSDPDSSENYIISDSAAAELRKGVLYGIIQQLYISTTSFDLLTCLLSERATHPLVIEQLQLELKMLAMNSIKISLLLERIIACLVLTQTYTLNLVEVEKATNRSTSIPAQEIWLWQTEDAENIYYRTLASDAYASTQSIQKGEPTLSETTVNQLAEAIKQHSLDTIELFAQQELIRYLKNKSHLDNLDMRCYFTGNTQDIDILSCVTQFLSPLLCEDAPNINSPFLALEGNTFIQDIIMRYSHEQSSLSNAFQRELREELTKIQTYISNSCQNLNEIRAYLTQQKNTWEQLLHDNTDASRTYMIHFEDNIARQLRAQSLTGELPKSPSPKLTKSFFFNPEQIAPEMSEKERTSNSSSPRSNTSLDFLVKIYENTENLEKIFNANVMSRDEDKAELLKKILTRQQLSLDQLHVVAWLVTQETLVPIRYIDPLKRCFGIFIQRETRITYDESRANAGYGALLRIACRLNDPAQLAIITNMLYQLCHGKPILEALEALSHHSALDANARRNFRSVKLPDKEPVLKNIEKGTSVLLTLAIECTRFREEKLEREKKQPVARSSIVIMLLGGLSWLLSEQLKKLNTINRKGLKEKLDAVEQTKETLGPDSNYDDALESLKQDEKISRKRYCTFVKETTTEKMIETISKLCQASPSDLGFRS